MSVTSVPETSRPPVTTSPRPGHALVIGAAGFAWCSLALGLSTVGAINAVGSSVILSGTFFYGGMGTRAKKRESGDPDFAFMQTRGAVRLMRAYAEISSRSTKYALVVLAESLRDSDRDKDKGD